MDEFVLVYSVRRVRDSECYLWGIWGDVSFVYQTQIHLFFFFSIHRRVFMKISFEILVDWL